MPKYGWIILIISCVLFSSLSFAMQNKGAEKLQLEGGSRGPVPFPHHVHQDRLPDCQVCHSVFPQEALSIETLKTNGQLKPKEVMNKQCVKCHRAEKKAGNKSGPTTCAQCHIRKKQ